MAVDWKEMFAYRDLSFLSGEDISVRYKQTVLGPAWAVFQPLFLMLIFTCVLRGSQNRFSGSSVSRVCLRGLIPWTLFSQGVSQSSLSLVNQTNLFTKVYFPRLFIPIAAASVFLVDLMFSLGIYAFVLLYYRFVPSWTIVFLPVLILLTLVATLGIGIMLSALTIFYRDFKHIVPFLIQIFMFVTPVIYSANVVSLSSDGSVTEPVIWNYGGIPVSYLGRKLECVECCLSSYLGRGGGGIIRARRVCCFPQDRASLC